MDTSVERPPNVVGSWLNYDRIRVEKPGHRDPNEWRVLEKRRAQRTKRQRAKRAEEWKAYTPPERTSRAPTYKDLLEKSRVFWVRRRERERSAGGSCSQDDLEAIRQRQDDRCRYCGKPLNGKGSRDHIEPLVRGGSNDPDNLQWLCKPCSDFKGSKPEQQFLAEFWAREVA
jgi:HNH endonuclease